MKIGNGYWFNVIALTHFLEWFARNSTKSCTRKRPSDESKQSDADRCPLKCNMEVVSYFAKNSR